MAFPHSATFAKIGRVAEIFRKALEERGFAEVILFQ